MTQPTQIESIQRDIACLHCNYNLRGLAGAIVTCPECGWKCDMAELVARQWRGPWWKAPGFTALAVPTAWAVVFVWAWLIIQWLSMLNSSPFESTPAAVWLALFVVAVVGLLGWVFLLLRVHQWWPGWRGIPLSILTFVAVVLHFSAFMSGLLLLVVLVPALNARRGGAVGLVGGNTMLKNILLLVFILLMIGMRWGGRRLERRIAKACIRRHLEGAWIKA